MITDPQFYLIAVFGVLLTGIAKGGFAGALGGVGVPLMALVISPVQAAGIMLPILIAMDAYGLKVFIKKCDWTVLRSMIPGMFVGMGLGTLAFGVLSGDAVRLIVGALAVGFPVYKTWERWNSRRTGMAVEATTVSVVKGNGWSTVSSFTSFIAHAGGPPYSVYAMPLKLDKQVYNATAAIFFAIVNFIKLPSYAWLGQINVTNWGTALLLLPLVPIGVRCGMWLQTKVKSDETFYAIGQSLMFVSGLKLLWDGMRVFS
jgi:uncharacterized protein